MTPQSIIRAVCQVYEVTPHSLVGPSRTAWLVEARMAATVLMRETGISLNHCGRVLNREHATILNLEMRAIRYAKAPHYAARLAAVRDWLKVAV